MSDLCDYCENDIEVKIYTDKQRFCSEDCRMSYHNTKRKAFRKFQAIENATSDMYAMLADDSMSGMHTMIVNMLQNAHHNIMYNPDKHGIIWRKCPECELQNRDNKLVCSCGAKTHFYRYTPPPPETPDPIYWD